MDNNIKLFRVTNNLTQEQLAKLTGCTRQTINAIEKNKYSPSLELAFKLAKTLKKTIDEIFIFKDK